MTAPDDPSDREFYLAALGASDETVEELLSGGTNVDDLMAAGVLDDEEPTPQEEEITIEPTSLTEREILAEMETEQEWLIANGHNYRPVRV